MRHPWILEPLRYVTLLMAVLGACGDQVGEVDAGIDSAPQDAPGSDAPATDIGVEDTSVDAGRDDAQADTGPTRGAPYPIVLAHGFFGFEDFAGAGFIDYFWRVRGDLEEDGELAFTPAVDPFNNSEIRGAQLLTHVEAILAETGHEKVNIIAHSQGGLDARYVASVRPDLVASVTTIATPHHGTPLLDLVVRANSNALRDVLDAIIRLVAGPLYDAAGNETSIFAALEQLSEEGAEAFSNAYPDSRDVAYFSIGGRSDRTFAFQACRPDGNAPDFIHRYRTFVDPIDPLLSVSESLFDGRIWDRRPNDGLVTVDSSRWGRFLGCIPADHLDQMGQLFGDDPGLINPWEHRTFYRELVAWLHAEGF